MASKKKSPQAYEAFDRIRELMARQFSTNLLKITEFDLTLSQAVALFCLCDDGPMVLTELTEIVSRSQSATSHLVEQLEQRGLVSRRTDDQDRRRRLIRVTKKGLALTETVRTTHQEMMTKAIESVPKPVVARLQAALEEFYDALKEGTGD